MRRRLLILLLAVGASSAGASEVEVTVSGLAGDALTNVRTTLAVAQREGDDSLNEKRIRALHEAAPARIRRALQPFGFYRPRIDARLTEPPSPGAAWRARFAVDPGDPLRVGEVEFTLTGPGAADDSLRTLRRRHLLQRGDVLDHRHYEGGKLRLLEALQRRGYLDADYRRHRVEVDLERYSAAITLGVDTGPRYVFGPMEFEGGRFARPYLEKYRVIEPGAPFDRGLLARQRAALSSSGHFREVVVEAGHRPEPVDGREPAIPVNVRLVPFEPNRYRGRVGWGTETGVGVQLNWTRRYLGRHGHRFNLGGTAVQERERLAGDLRYTIPIAPLSGHELELGARHESKDLNFRDVDLEEGGDTRIAANFLSLLWNRPGARLGPFGAQLSAGLNLVGESYDVFNVLFGNLPEEAQAAIIDEIGPLAVDTLAPDFHALIPELRFDLRRSDDDLYIRRGDYLGLRLLGADDALGSNISFWQARLSHWSIWPIGRRGRLLLRTALGYSQAESREVLGATFNQMPEFYEFRGGGARDIRGYGFETIFPQDGITGGRHRIVASLEYEQPIIQDWSAALFVDSGNVFNRWGDFEPVHGVGLGARWRSPVGPVRIDVGVPLDDADSAFQLYITVGPEF